MATLQDLANQHTELDATQLRHLRRLTSSWGMLADLCFADLQLFLPVTRNAGAEPRFVIAGHVRPTTAQTLYRDDQVGRFVTERTRPLVANAFSSLRPVRKEVELEAVGVPAAILAVPVCHEGQTIAVVTRESPRVGGREISELERAYVEVFEGFAKMIHEGTFPFDTDDSAEQSARVGDGAIVLDAEGKVTFTSPNAVSALHRMGFHMNAVGRHVDDLGFEGHVLRTAFSLRVPITQELERGTTTTIHARILPLFDGLDIAGALVLLRDVSDLRQQERLLVSMDATIREIHHRVKNNLQTVSSLMRMQGRRVAQPEAKAAIDEAVRRIRSIALVHEILAQDGGDDVRLAEVIRPITSMVEEALVSPDRPVRFSVVGDGPTLPANVASSLAVVLTELLQNAVEHGYPPGTSGGQVILELETSGHRLVMRVHDDGAGLPEGFDLATSEGLGLTIARTLASGELGGQLSLRPASGTERTGTIAELRVDLHD